MMLGPGDKGIPDGSQHGDKAVASMCQGKNLEFAKNIFSVGGAREKRVQVLLVYTLWEESDDSKEISSVIAEFTECWGRE